ncbi:MAG TPA: hypothetical protein VNF50_00755 [Acidimicrobiales bacterium]|nr:hypothetical protein [Acidimicrobiales bacterium]
MAATPARHVVILAPMPHEMDAIVAAFGLRPTNDTEGSSYTGRVGGSEVSALHIGMGPALTRAALGRVFAEAEATGTPVDHVMNAGICGGRGPDLPVGAVINPEIIVHHQSGASYRHSPPGDAPRAGRLITTETIILDPDLSRKFLADGCVAVDMESAAVAEVCEARGCPWSVYRCIGDRWFDGLLDRHRNHRRLPGSGRGKIGLVHKHHLDFRDVGEARHAVAGRGRHPSPQPPGGHWRLRIYIGYDR